MGEGNAGPRILVVTDRRRLTQRVGAPEDAWAGPLEAQIAGALAGGADVVQVREPDLGPRVLTAFLRHLFQQLPGSHTRVLVNDRADIALVTGAGGVHLTERSLGVTDIRRLRPADKSWVTGRSVHDPETAMRHREANYLLAGTVRASASKPAGWPVIGWDGLAAIVRAAGSTPVVAIGGLTLGDIGEVGRAGASGLAGIGCFLPDADADVAASVESKVQGMRKAFDSMGGEF